MQGYPCTSARLLCLPTCVLSVYLPTCACPPAVHWTATGGHCLPSHSQVHWHASLDHVPAGLPTLWLAHEFLDALPVHQFVRHPQRGWLEVRRRRCGLTPAGQRCGLTPAGQRCGLTPAGQRCGLTPAGQRCGLTPAGQPLHVDVDSPLLASLCMLCAPTCAARCRHMSKASPLLCPARQQTPL
jgi:Putative S-adenosyl-L-methionine-dependent methyltransferase